MIVPSLPQLVAGADIWGPPLPYRYPYLEQQPTLWELLTTTAFLLALCVAGQAVKHMLYYHWHERLWDFFTQPLFRKETR